MTGDAPIEQWLQSMGTSVYHTIDSKYKNGNDRAKYLRTYRDISPPKFS